MMRYIHRNDPLDEHVEEEIKRALGQKTQGAVVSIWPPEVTHIISSPANKIGTFILRQRIGQTETVPLVRDELYILQERWTHAQHLATSELTLKTSQCTGMRIIRVDGMRNEVLARTFDGSESFTERLIKI